MASRNHTDPPFAGYLVGSLALIADAYHMLNDAMSLVIALYAIKVKFSLYYSAIYERTLIQTRTISCPSAPPQPSIPMDGTVPRSLPLLLMAFSSARSAFLFLWKQLSALSIRRVCTL